MTMNSLLEGLSDDTPKIFRSIGDPFCPVEKKAYWTVDVYPSKKQIKEIFAAGYEYLYFPFNRELSTPKIVMADHFIEYSGLMVVDWYFARDPEKNWYRCRGFDGKSKPYIAPFYIKGGWTEQWCGEGGKPSPIPAPTLVEENAN